MISPFSSILLLALFTPILFGQKQPEPKEVFIKGRIEPILKFSRGTPEPGEIAIEVRYNNEERAGCYQELEEGVICRSYASKNYQLARIEVVAPGYKKYSRNIPQIKFQKNQAWIDVGLIKLVPSELPTIQQILHFRGKDESHRIEITLHNPLKREFLVTQLGLRAHGETPNGIACGINIGQGPEIKIEQTLKITSVGTDTMSVESTFRDTTRREDYSAKAKGYIKRRVCGGLWAPEDFFLEIPVSFVLPSNQYIKFSIELPKRFNVVEVKDMDYLEGAPPKLKAIADGNVDYFGYYTLSIRTSKEEELEIKGGISLK